MRISSNLRNTLADAFATAVDAGASDSAIELRTGAPPASITDPAAGTLLATVTLPSPAFGAASEGTITANAIDPAVASDSGDVGHFRIRDGDGNVVEDSGSVGTTGSEEMTLDTVEVASGGSVQISTWTVTMPSE